MSGEMLERRFPRRGARAAVGVGKPRTRSPVYLRQGKWFFVPAPEVHPPLTLVLFDEPLPRECGTAHVMQFAYRRGVSWYGSAGGTQAVLDVGVFAKGAVRHPDHATLVLRGWHRVATPAPSTKTM